MTGTTFWLTSMMMLSMLLAAWPLFYEKGMSGNSFLRKEKFRPQLPRKEKGLKSVRKTVR